jgi:SEC-C motif-containing protein
MGLCPCGSGADIEECCGPVVRGETDAGTAEALMRSRYTAFVLGDRDHIDRTRINRTWAQEKRAAEAADDGHGSVKWAGLTIFDTTGGGPQDETGTVTFAARFWHEGILRVHRERSNFHREDGRWMYVDGDVDFDDPAETAKPPGTVGRNDPCPCGSGKKFKKCCGT